MIVTSNRLQQGVMIVGKFLKIGQRVLAVTVHCNQSDSTLVIVNHPIEPRCVKFGERALNPEETHHDEFSLKPWFELKAFAIDRLGGKTAPIRFRGCITRC